MHEKFKRNLLIVIFLIFLESGFANDTYFSLSGGNLVPVNDGNTSVEMKEEEITLNFNDDYYEVTVNFSFYNSADTEQMLVGFPFLQMGNLGSGSIYDFHCWTNDEETDFENIEIIRQWSGVFDDEPEYACTRKITFEKGKITKTRISYKSTYGHAWGDGYYLFGTGLSWNKDIGKITVNVINNFTYKYFDIARMGNSIWGNDIKNQFHKTGDNCFQAIFYNVEPENYTDVFYFHFRDILNDDGPKRFPENFPFDKSVSSVEVLSWYTKAQLRIIRNTIYALHGYTFKSEDLKSYFEDVGTGWYPTYQDRVKAGFNEADLTEIEKANVQLILAEEQNR